MLAAAVGLAQIPLDYHRLSLEPVQAAYLLAAYLLLALPFFFSAGSSPRPTWRSPVRSGVIYFNLHGGLGPVGVFCRCRFFPFSCESALIVIAALWRWRPRQSS